MSQLPDWMDRRDPKDEDHDRVKITIVVPRNLIEDAVTNGRIKIVRVGDPDQQQNR